MGELILQRKVICVWTHLKKKNQCESLCYRKVYTKCMCGTTKTYYSHCNFLSIPDKKLYMSALFNKVYIKIV
jgi:hypothetical protein